MSNFSLKDFLLYSNCNLDGKLFHTVIYNYSIGTVGRKAIFETSWVLSLSMK